MAATHTQPVVSNPWRECRSRDGGDRPLAALERALLEASPTSGLRARIAALLPEVRAYLRSDDLLEEVLEADPVLAGRVTAVRDLREGVVQGLEELRAELRARPGAVSRATRRDLARGLRALRRAEERLLLDAYCLDLGGEGC